MRRFIGVAAFIGILATVAIADASSRVPLTLKIEPQSAIDPMNPAAKVRFYLQSWPAETDSMFILDPNDEVIAVARRSTEAIGFVYGSGTHRVNAEVYDAKGISSAARRSRCLSPSSPDSGRWITVLRLDWANNSTTVRSQQCCGMSRRDSRRIRARLSKG